MRHKTKLIFCTLMIATTSAAPARAQSADQLSLNLGRKCSTHSVVGSKVFPAYDEWVVSLRSKVLASFKTSLGASLENGRLISSNSSGTVCRYDINPGRLFASSDPTKTVRNLDMRLTLVNGQPKWEVLIHEGVAPSDYTEAQANELFGHFYVNNQPLLEWAEAHKGTPKPAQPQPRNVAEGLAQAQERTNEAIRDLARSQGIDVDAIEKAEAEETRKYAEPCRRNGGTWGRPLNQYGIPTGRLGCYYPTGAR